MIGRAGGRDPLAHPGPLIERLYSYVAYRIGHGAEAEDVVSATLERAVRYRASYDHRKGEPVAWLLGIARRELADRAQANRDVSWDVNEIESQQDLEGETVRRLDIRAAMTMLEPRDRELISLRYGADLPAREIARILDLRVNAVEVALHRAVRRLRDLVEAAPVEGRPPAAGTGVSIEAQTRY